MELRMKVPYEKGVAIRSAPGFALGAVKCPVKRKQGKRWAGYRASKIYNQGADAVTQAEGHTTGSVSASCWSALRSRRPHARLETPCTRTGRPRRCLTKRKLEVGRREKAQAARPACPSSRSRTAVQYQCADSGARRTGFRGERENDSGVKTNRIPG